jgi:hypothetical protein
MARLVLWVHCPGHLSLLPPTSSWNDVQNMTRLDPSTKPKSSWSCPQVPSCVSGSQSLWRRLPTWSISLGIHPEDSKLSGVLGEWVIWVHEKHQLDPLRLVCIRPINLVHIFTLKQKERGGGILTHKRRQSSGGFEKLTHGHSLDWNSSTEVWSQCYMLRGQS